MSVAPAVKRERDCASGGGGPVVGAGVGLVGDADGGGSPGRKRRKQAAPARAPQPPLDLHAKMADIYKSALAFGELTLPTFDPLAAFRLLPRHDPPRIFNPEAYCDLCCKEFCNKYFLKTHRANKHGIYDGEQQPHPGLPSQPQISPPRRASDEESGGTPRRLSPDSARRAREAAFQPDVLRRLGVTNPEAFCEICCKEYCNKYFLRTHRERRHGVTAHRSPVADRSPAAATPPMMTPHSMSPHAPTPPRAFSLPPPFDPEEPLEVKREQEDREDFEAVLREGQTSPLNLIVEERSAASPGSASEELRKLQTMISQLNELAAERLAEEPSEAPRPPSSSPPPQDERRSGGAGSSFCEICNKELCNKYFMRTHMQRMHGISLESGTQLGGVTCDICHKELCSKYFLRVHKHNTHGIPAPPAPANAAPAEPCPLCSRRFRGPRALRAHLLAEHAPPTRPPPPPPMPPRPLDLLARDKPYACSYCPFTTEVLAFLFAHERAHVQRAQEQAEGGEMEGDTGAEEPSESVEPAGEVESDTEAYSCSRCEFRAESFAALEAHVRATHGGAGALLAVPRAPRAPLTMQPFVLEEAGGALSLLPALVFLPVRRRATRRATVTLTLTPA